ncbi:MAG TPA: serine/threonine-protein kinase [Planctomycetota bacterium]|nr:serine/threonine-protein kinase [Planctomycetota bacterium]
MGLDSYEILAEVGRGGVGVVYKARGPHGMVAIKLLQRGAGPDLASFERERRLHETLGEKEGFVPFVESGDSPKGPYLVMPFLAGGTLRARLEAGPLPVEETVALGQALASALGRAHRLGIVHRDLKPENILHADGGEPLVADLGLAKYFVRDEGGRSRISITLEGAFKGTAGYMPREQMSDAKSVDARADVFALGAILYECLAGRPAFPGQTALESMTLVDQGKFEPLATARPDAPGWLVAAIERAIARDAEARFPDARGLQAALEEGEAAADRRRALAVTGALLAVALAGGVALALLVPGKEPQATPPTVAEVVSPDVPAVPAPPTAVASALPATEPPGPTPATDPAPAPIESAPRPVEPAPLPVEAAPGPSETPAAETAPPAPPPAAPTGVAAVATAVAVLTAGDLVSRGVTVAPGAPVPLGVPLQTRSVCEIDCPDRVALTVGEGTPFSLALAGDTLTWAFISGGFEARPLGKSRFGISGVPAKVVADGAHFVVTGNSKVRVATLEGAVRVGEATVFPGFEVFFTKAAPVPLSAPIGHLPGFVKGRAPAIEVLRHFTFEEGVEGWKGTRVSTGAHGSQGALRAVASQVRHAAGTELLDQNAGVVRTDPDLWLELTVKVDVKSRVSIQVWDGDSRASAGFGKMIEKDTWTTLAMPVRTFSDRNGAATGHAVPKGDRITALHVSAGTSGEKIELLVDDVRFFTSR